MLGSNTLITNLVIKYLQSGYRNSLCVLYEYTIWENLLYWLFGTLKMYVLMYN